VRSSNVTMENFSWATLLLAPLGLILMLWQWPNGDRYHLKACLIGGAVWCALAVWDPALDVRRAFFPAAGLFLIALFRHPLPGPTEPSQR